MSRNTAQDRPGRGKHPQPTTERGVYVYATARQTDSLARNRRRRSR